MNGLLADKWRNRWMEELINEWNGHIAVDEWTSG